MTFCSVKNIENIEPTLLKQAPTPNFFTLDLKNVGLYEDDVLVVNLPKFIERVRNDVNNSIKRKMNNEEKKLFGIEKLNIKRSNIPAVTHVDYSARIQTVHEETNPKYYKLLQNFKKITNCPIVVNTSFNIRGEPIVCNIQDAYRCFMGTDLDILVCENFILYKEKQNTKFKQEYKNQFLSED